MAEGSTSKWNKSVASESYAELATDSSLASSCDAAKESSEAASAKPWPSDLLAASAASACKAATSLAVASAACALIFSMLSGQTSGSSFSSGLVKPMILQKDIK